MENLVGRESEREQLQTLLQSDKAELLAVYGRRRIGKTFLINRFFGDKGVYFEMTGIKSGSLSQQLKVFRSRFRLAFPNFSLKNKQLNDWFDAFELLQDAITEYRGEKKIILFFDEFPWMDVHKSGLIKAFEGYWNGIFSKNPKMIIILCGSSVAWMIKKIIRNRAGLHGRLTAKMRLRPFTLYETELYFRINNIAISRKQIAELYMILGGIPKYLSYIQPGQSSAQIVHSLCFISNAPLIDEFEQLYESLFDNYQLHLKIIEYLGGKRTGATLNEIIAYTKIKSGGSLTRAMRELVASDFIQKIPFFGKKNREGKYRLIDEYSYFYLNWMKNALIDQREPLSEHYWMKKSGTNEYKIWSGYSFETLCFKHIRQIVEAMKLSVVADSATYWAYFPKKGSHEKGAEIDLIIDRTDQCINLCEMKFYRDEYVLNEEKAKKLNSRREIFRQQAKTKKALFNTLITSFGAKTNAHYLSAVDTQLDMNALFQTN
ncbi:MAG: ATP-binding protein [Chlamydiales bacterium]